MGSFLVGSFLTWELSLLGKFPARRSFVVWELGQVCVKEIYYSIVAQADSTGV